MKHAAASFFFSLGVGVCAVPLLVTVLVRFRAGQHVAAYGPESHRVKEGTPTMGGILFVVLVIASWVAFDRSRAGFVAAFALAAGAAIGLLDDVINARQGRDLGLSVRHKLALQAGVGVLVGIGLLAINATHQKFPGLGAPSLGWGIVVVAALAVVACTNAVNLTDGVDGLAGTCCAIAIAALGIIALRQHNVPVEVIGFATCGALVAFLLANWHPARLFMGDTGSLGLGAVLVALSAEVGMLWLLPLLGIVFVAETLSVIINVTAIRRYQRRIFRASPIHHHFEEMGLREERLVMAFGGIAVVAGVLTILVAGGAVPQ